MNKAIVALKVDFLNQFYYADSEFGQKSFSSRPRFFVPVFNVETQQHVFFLSFFLSFFFERSYFLLILNFPVLSY
jgi:hypothetical protein